MRLHKTGHIIADTVSDLIGDLPDGDYEIAYGILRHGLFKSGFPYFEIDKGYWGAEHYHGNYRISFNGTQAKYFNDGDARDIRHEPHGLTLSDWYGDGHVDLICPPTQAVCAFFDIDADKWLKSAKQFNRPYNQIIRHKGDNVPFYWEDIRQVITFNSTIAIEALIRGIPVISDPVHSSVGNFCAQKGTFYGYDRNELLSFMQAHQFKLTDKPKIERLINYYLEQDCKSTSDSIVVSQ